MAESIIQKSGGGAASDECSAAKVQVLAGYTAVTKDSDDEPVLGTMANRGAVNQALNCGGSYTIPAGYHSGTGVVRANTLAAQTSATATAARIYTGQTAWVNGVKITGTMTVNSILSFSAAAYSTNQILLKWQNPYAASGKPFSGVRICWSISGYPGSGGTWIYTGYGDNATPGGWSSVIVSLPEAGRGYYFSAQAFAKILGLGLASNELLDSAGQKNAYAATTAHGRQVFTSSGTFTVPANVRLIDIHCTGGGGASGTPNEVNRYGGGGGGGGYTAYKTGIPVNPGSVISIVVGTGSEKGGYEIESGVYGGTSSANMNGSVLMEAKGGRSGFAPITGYTPGQGGSGGGGGEHNSDRGPGNGGSDGGPGNHDGVQYGDDAPGQGTTTREFGWGTLYSGGGGGGPSMYGIGGSGGAGGGGAGARVYSGNQAFGVNGTVGTGGGAGGYGSKYVSNDSIGWFCSKGGSGNVIIRW